MKVMAPSSWVQTFQRGRTPSQVLACYPTTWCMFS